MRAAGLGRTDCARLLLDAGADKDAKDDVRRRSLLSRYAILLICPLLTPNQLLIRSLCCV